MPILFSFLPAVLGPYIYIYIYILYMYYVYVRYDEMSRQVIIEIRLGCQKRIIYRQDPVPHGHEVGP